MNRYVFGVDLGVRKVAIACPKLRYATSLELGIRDHPREVELRTIAEFVRSARRDACISYRGAYLPALSIDLFIEEAYLSNGAHRNQTTTVAMAEVVGAVLAAEVWGSSTKVSNSAWKAALLSDGRADKPAIGAWLKRYSPALYEACSGHEDRIDATCIGIYGDMRQAGTIPPPAPKKKKVRKSARAT